MPAAKESRITQFRNCLILWDQQLIREDLWIRGGKIIDPEKLFYVEQKTADVVVECHGATIAPGFIDVQINGAFGIDFSVETDDIRAGVGKVAKGLLSHGVTSFCPTVVTSLPDSYRKILPQIERRNGSSEGAGVLGVHLEGPFISLREKGAHTPEYITGFDHGFADLLTMYGSLDSVSIFTLAPELDNALDIIQALVSKGITVSLGHSMANLGQGEEAVKAGASFITHLFNAMLPFHHRDPHLVGLLTSDQIPAGRTVYYGIISDGIHTQAAALRIAHRSHPKGLVLVTDAIAAMGLGYGIHRLGHQTIEVRDNKAVIAGTDNLCGSIATMNECIQFLYENTECDKVESLEAATLHPAELLNITNRKGTLDYDTDADFVILDSNSLSLQKTYINGELVWTSEET